MLVQTLRASRQSLVRGLSRQNVCVSRRTFAASTIARADIIQDMYLKELKAYKPTPIKPSDADAHVQKFKAPAAPALPEDIDVATELKEYEAQQPDVEGQSGEAGSAPVEKDWFEQPEEDEEGHGHH